MIGNWSSRPKTSSMMISEPPTYAVMMPKMQVRAMAKPTVCGVRTTSRAASQRAAGEVDPAALGWQGLGQPAGPQQHADGRQRRAATARSATGRSP